MARAELCKDCLMIDSCKEARYYCCAMKDLYETYDDCKKLIAREFIAEHREKLSIEDAEYSEEYEKLSNKVIDAVAELQYIRDYDIKIGYVKSYEEKVKDGRIIYADCRKVNAIYQCFAPYDFIITIYEPNAMLLTMNQIKVLLWHELRHVGINERTLKTEYKVMLHEVEDFHSIIDRFGTRWNEPNTEIEDICKEV